MAAQDIPGDFERAKPSLRPVILNRSFFDELKIQSKIDLSPLVPIPFMPVGDHLVACVVYVRGSARQFVHRRVVEKWRVRYRDVLRAARKNISDTLNGSNYNDSVFAPDVADTFDASRILWKRPIRKLPVIGDPVAMAVNGNRLFITGSKDKKGLALMAELAEECFSEPDLLCPTPVRLVGKIWKTWMPSTEHSHYETYKRLARRFFRDAYHNQQQRLTNMYETINEDIFVASFTAIRNTKTGEELSYTVWADGVPTLLPQADRVHFFVSEDEPVHWASWSDVITTVGHMMEEQRNRHPPRWQVEGYPSESDFRRMRAKRL